MPELPPHAAAALAQARATAPAPVAQGFTLFAYGSMVANQPFPVAAKRVATLTSHHRAWTLHDPERRGTPEQPGRVLTLDPGGTCTGLALTVAPDHADEALQTIFAQELLLPWYVPAWLPVRTAAGEPMALAFLTDPASPHRAPDLASPVLAHLIATRAGQAGPNLDYLRETVDGLHANDIRDEQLETLLEAAERT